MNEKGETLQSVEMSSLIAQADTVDNQLQLQKLAVESSLGNLSSQGKLQLDGDMPRFNFKIPFGAIEIRWKRNSARE